MNWGQVFDAPFSGDNLESRERVESRSCSGCTHAVPGPSLTVYYVCANCVPNRRKDFHPTVGVGLLISMLMMRGFGVESVGIVA